MPAACQIHFELLGDEVVDGLCPKCWNPALVSVSGYLKIDREIGGVTSWQACGDCGHVIRGLFERE
jgi:hypothetical protein